MVPPLRGDVRGRPLTDGAIVMPAPEDTRRHPPARAVPRGYAAALWVLLSLFVVRVVGQALVAFLYAEEDAG